MTTRHRMNALVVAIGLLLAASAALSQGIDFPDEPIGNLPGAVKRALFQAQGLQKEQRYAEAVDVLAKCLSSDPRNDGRVLRFHLGNALMLADRLDDARQHYEACVRHDDKSAQGWFQLARVSYELGDYARAAQAFAAVNGLLPQRNAQVLYFTGIAHLMNEKPSPAFEALSQLVGGAFGPPSLDWCNTFVSAAYAANRITESFPVLRALVEREPGSVGAWRLLYQAGLMARDYRQAAVALTVADYVQPIDRKELVELANLYEQIDVPVRAIPYYKRALSSGADGDAAKLHERIAGAYLSARDYDGAIEFLGDVLERAPTPVLWSLLGDVHYKRDEYEQALNAFGRCVALDPEEDRALYMMGLCAYELERYDEARQHTLAAARFERQSEAADRLLRAIERRR